MFDTEIAIMSSPVSWLVELEIRPEQLDAFFELSEEMTAAAFREEGTLVFERYRDRDDGVVHLFECYVNSEAAVIHLTNFRSEFSSRFAPLVERKSFCFFGEPNAQLTTLLTEILAPLPFKPIPLLVGFNRSFDNPSSKAKGASE